MKLANLQSILRQKLGASDKRKGTFFLMSLANEEVVELQTAIFSNDLAAVKDEIQDNFVIILSLANYFGLNINSKKFEKHLLGSIDEIRERQQSEEDMNIGKIRPTIVVSGLPGCGKNTVARMISERFGLKHISGSEVFKKFSESRAGLHQNWWDSHEGMSFLNARLDNCRYDAYVDRVLIKAAQRGNVVIDSWITPWLLKDCFRIWLNSSKNERAKRIMQRSNVNSETAMNLLTERERKSILIHAKSLEIEYGKDFSAFEIVLNVDSFPLKHVLTILSSAIYGYYSSYKG